MKSQAKPAYPVEGKSRMASSKDLQAHTRHRDYEEEQKLQPSSSSEPSQKRLWCSEHSLERLGFASLSSAASCYNVHVCFSSYTASETGSPPHYEVT